MFLNLSPPEPGDMVFDISKMCPPGSIMVDGVCVGAGGADEFLKREKDFDRLQYEEFLKREAAKVTGIDTKPTAINTTPSAINTTGGGVSPALVLAAVAAYFIAG
jgi:hypothetical protein